MILSGLLSLRACWYDPPQPNDPWHEGWFSLLTLHMDLATHLPESLFAARTRINPCVVPSHGTLLDHRTHRRAPLSRHGLARQVVALFTILVEGILKADPLT